MSSQEKLRFPRLLKELRDERGLKQREVADSIGLKTSSYGNCEANNHKTMAEPKVRRLAATYKLTAAATADLLAAWSELPPSEYSQRQAKTYEERRASRNKARDHDGLKLAGVFLANLLVTEVASPELLCTCPVPDFAGEAMCNPFAGDPCDLCFALVELGVPGGWTNREAVTAALAEIQERMTS